MSLSITHSANYRGGGYGGRCHNSVRFWRHEITSMLTVRGTLLARILHVQAVCLCKINEDWSSSECVL